MNLSRAIHEALMNESGTILPRVGGGVGVGGGDRDIAVAYHLKVGAEPTSLAAANTNNILAAGCANESRRWLR